MHTSNVSYTNPLNHNHCVEKWRMSVVMFYLVQLFVMPSATSDVLHDLEEHTGYIRDVGLLNIEHTHGSPQTA